MAFPYVFHSNFEAGSNAEWDSESDTGSLLDFPHYSTLARVSGVGMPFGGAYCMRVVCGDTNDHTLTEGDIDIADAATGYFRFYLHASTDFTATADDTFNIFELQQGGGTVEVSLGMRVTSATNALDIGIGDGTAPTSFASFPRGKWVCVELLATISTGGSGVVTLFLDGGQVATLTSQTHAAAVGQGVLGTQNTLATTTGTLLFDDFVMDDARLFPVKDRFPANVDVTKTGHLFVGPGVIDGASFSVTTSDNTLSCYDTDTANTNDPPVFTIANAGIPGISGPLFFKRGCYAVLGGTNPRAQVYLTQGSQVPGVVGPTCNSEGRIRQHAYRR